MAWLSQRRAGSGSPATIPGSNGSGVAVGTDSRSHASRTCRAAAGTVRAEATWKPAGGPSGTRRADRGS